MLLGLRSSFETGAVHFPTWALLLGLGGYTLLLASAACVLVRIGNVWDDVRTLLLLIVLVFLTISVIFDDILTRDPRLGSFCDIGGLLFAIVVSEGLLLGMRFTLPMVYRVPYYLILALFFLYPVSLGPLWREPSNPVLLWRLFGFSPLAGCLFLTLVPAIRRGPAAVRKSGTPWPWPLYPWSLFALLAFGVCVRSYYLCLSVNTSGDSGGYEGLFSTIFGPYFLVPFLLALNVLLLEAGLVSGRRGVTRAAMLAPVALLMLTVVGHHPDAVYQRFLGMFTTRLGGSPLFVTLLIVSVFYAYAATRRATLALEGLTGCLAAFAVVEPSTLHLGELAHATPSFGPILAASLLQFSLGAWRREIGRCVLACGGLMVSSWIGLEGTWAMPYRGPLIAHVALAVALGIGAVRRDEWGAFLRNSSMVALIMMSYLALVGGPGIPLDRVPLVRFAYPPLAVVVALAYGAWLRDRLSLIVSALIAGGWVTAGGWEVYDALRQRFIGLNQIAWGLLSFVLALAISLTKAGVPQRWVRHHWERLERHGDSPPIPPELS